MTRSQSLRNFADRALRAGLERLNRSGPVIVPEYRLDLRARWGWGDAPTLSAIEALLTSHSADYEAAIDGAADLHEWAAGVPKSTDRSDEPCWENDWWGTVDALVQVDALRTRNPATYLEVGSGFSTLFARRAIRDLALQTQIVSIDPVPRHGVDSLCEVAIRQPLEQVVPDQLPRLTAGDVVLIDGSHLALMNSDATVFFLEMLPRLPAGVLVGIDDVFLPWDYPPQWAGRFYGEQYLLAAFLLGGAAGCAIRFPGWWIVQCSPLAARFDALWPIVENRFGRHATSFWLETS